MSAPLPGKPANFLILGSDHRGNTDASDKRSDTLMMVRLDPKSKTISMLSFPRDLYVNIPGHGQSKINDAYALGGPDLTLQTVKELTGLDTNFLVTVDFIGFRGIVDTLGGVYVDVDRHYFNDNSGGEIFSAIDVQSGYQRLDGRDALAYARYRHGDSDFHRIARQQQLLGALKKQISGSKVAKNAYGLAKIVEHNTDSAVGGGGGVSLRVIMDYIRLALALSGDDIYQVEVKGGIGTGPGGASIVEADQGSIDAAVAAFLNPDKKAQQATADQVTGQKGDSNGGSDSSSEKPKEIAPSSITVVVKNGNGRAGAAGSAADGLRSLGYAVTVPEGAAGNADNQNYANTQIRYTGAGNKAKAEQIAELFTGATASVSDGSNTFTSQVLVIVGKTGDKPAGATDSSDDGSVATIDSNKVPEKAAPTVVRDPEYARDKMSELGPAVGVPLLYPTVREQSSNYVDVHKYRVLKGKARYGAYRLVAKMASSDGAYWGLQGTAWPNPPILDDPTRSVRRGAIEYHLYFNGTKLHMVAWRQGAGTYWISNTVMDDLSNETMLAIAQSVKPYK